MLPWILTALCVAAVGVLTALLAKAKQKATKAELEDTKQTLEKQKAVVREHETYADKASEIQREAKQTEEALATVVKEAQTSEEPVKKSISVGNDIVAGFNSSNQL